jgi:hypothetical protein
MVMKSNTDMELPCLREDLKETELAHSILSITLNLNNEPTFTRPCTLHVEPIDMKDLSEMVEPIIAKSKTLRALPFLTAPRILTLELKWPNESVEMLPPMRHLPWIETAEPMRELERSDIAEPKFENDSTLMIEPHRTIWRVDTTEPHAQ